MTVEIRRVGPEDDLAAVAAAVVGSEWGDDNELDDYDETALAEIASNQDTILLVAWDDGLAVGLALAVRLLKPDGDHWLYVDEVDVRPGHRRLGIGRALMDRLVDEARTLGLGEVWLGTEPDNQAANALYSSLGPAEVETFVGYTFRPTG